jgi:hypothetical protein
MSTVTGPSIMANSNYLLNKKTLIPAPNRPASSMTALQLTPSGNLNTLPYMPPAQFGMGAFGLTDTDINQIIQVLKVPTKLRAGLKAWESDLDEEIEGTELALSIVEAFDRGANKLYRFLFDEEPDKSKSYGVILKERELQDLARQKAVARIGSEALTLIEIDPSLQRGIEQVLRNPSSFESVADSWLRQQQNTGLYFQGQILTPLQRARIASFGVLILTSAAAAAVSAVPVVELAHFLINQTYQRWLNKWYKLNEENKSIQQMAEVAELMDNVVIGEKVGANLIKYGLAPFSLGVSIPVAGAIFGALSHLAAGSLYWYSADYYFRNKDIPETVKSLHKISHGLVRENIDKVGDLIANWIHKEQPQKSPAR